MARPSRDNIQAAVAGWDALVNNNFQRLLDSPVPFPVHSGDESDLESTYPAASYDKCWIWVDHTVDGWVIYESDGTDWAVKSFGGTVEVEVNTPLAVAVTDEVSSITTGDAKVTFRMPDDFTATEVWASLTTASSSGTVTVDVEKNGASIFTTDLITIDATDKTSQDATTPPNLTTTAFLKDDEITINIDGAGTGAKGLKVYFVGFYSGIYNPLDYSTSEQVTGMTWIDGDPIYRKTVSCSLPNANTTTTAHGAANVETIVKLEGRYIDGSSDTFPLPRAASVDNDNIEASADTTNIYLKSGGNHSGGSGCYVDIYYTKTTD